MVIDLPRVAAILDRIAADIDELARARRVQDLNTAAALPDPRAERRRRLAELDLEFRAFCIRRRLPASSTPQLERAWEGYGQDKHETHSGPASPCVEALARPRRRVLPPERLSVL